jgi:hypothetical protein
MLHVVIRHKIVDLKGSTGDGISPAKYQANANEGYGTQV